MTQADRLKKLMNGRSVRGDARQLAARYGKTVESWRQQLTRWRRGAHIGDENAELLEDFYGAEAGYLKDERVRRDEEFLADGLERVASTVEGLATRVSEIERRLGL